MVFLKQKVEYSLTIKVFRIYYKFVNNGNTVNIVNTDC